MPRAPRFDRPRHVRAPEERQREDQEDQVVLPVVHLHQPVQRADGATRRELAGVDRLTQRSQPRRRELLLLELLEQVSEDVEVARRSRRRDAARARRVVAAARRSPTWMASAICSGPSLPPDSHTTAGHDDRRGQRDGDPSRHRRCEQRRRFGPADELVAVHAGRDVSAGHRQRLRADRAAERTPRRPPAVAAISAGAAGAVSQRASVVFAGARARDRQQLEERTVAEQVEVVRVEVVVVAKTIAGLARACPAVLDSGQAAFVERDGARRLVALTNHPLVPADEDDEGGDGQDEQPDAQHLLPCGGPRAGRRAQTRRAGRS